MPKRPPREPSGRIPITPTASQVEANARLHHAAPELYELAKLFKSKLDWEIRAQSPGGTETSRLLAATMARVDETLAMAEGAKE